MVCLEKNQSEKDIYLEKPYQNVDIFWQPKEAEKEEYFEKLENYSYKVEKLIEPYILLPEEKDFNLQITFWNILA